VHYQAQVDLASGRLCGAEALVRWQHPTRGLLGPGEFIAVAEESGLIVRLGGWVLHEALRQLAQWRRGGLTLPQMSVNVSSLQLQRVGLSDSVREALSSTGVDAPGLCLELTESAIIESGPQVSETLNAVKQLGVKLALDDFGTGYSSLTYLRRFPIDELKIDRSFVSECDGDGNNAALTAAIIAMAHRLGLRVVAEGVETPQQLAFIRANGGDAFQGFLFARPLPAEEFAALLAPARSATPLRAAAKTA
jgi:EAL domain-containing protein (putative c-di-GMP-specific phosphodiesterase class I)